MIEICRRTSRNVKRWQSGDMCLRWTAAGMLEAERQSARSSARGTQPAGTVERSPLTVRAALTDT